MFNFSNLKQLILIGTVLSSISASAQWADDQPMPSGHERSPVFSTSSGAFIGLSKGFFEADVDGYPDAGN